MVVKQTTEFGRHVSYPMTDPCMVYMCKHKGGILMVNVTIYSIHGSYGYGTILNRIQIIDKHNVDPHLCFEMVDQVSPISMD